MEVFMSIDSNMYNQANQKFTIPLHVQRHFYKYFATKQHVFSLEKQLLILEISKIRHFYLQAVITPISVMKNELVSRFEVPRGLKLRMQYRLNQQQFELLNG